MEGCCKLNTGFTAGEESGGKHVKAESLKLKELLEVRPAEGKILLNNTRVLIMNADAMGKLRQDLISTLGLDRAKGFLTRYGWACGFSDALSIKEQIKWDNETEWVFAGAAMHKIEGIVCSEIENSSYDKEKKRWLSKRKWYNSFEAEQHLRYFGVHDSPVCWILTGYAGGYASAVLDHRVIYKEIQCVGKGDPYCQVIGKAVEEWGDEIDPELSYYEEFKISEELEAAHRRINQQHQILQKAFNINQALTSLVLKGEGLFGITQTLSKIIRGPILVFDSKIQNLASYPAEDFDVLKLQKKIQKYLFNVLESSQSRRERNILIVEKSPLKVEILVDNILYYCTIFTIIAAEQIMGFVAAARTENYEHELDFLMAIERSANVYALELIKQKSVIDLEQQVRGDFLATILHQHYTNMETLKAWGLRIGYKIDSPHLVLVMGIRKYDHIRYNSEEKVMQMKNELLQIANSYFKVNLPGTLCGKLEEQIIILLPAASMVEKKNISDLIKGLEKNIKSYFPKLNICIGVGRVVKNASDYILSYKQAVKALDVSALLEVQNQILFFDDLGSLAVLLEARNKKELLDFMEQKLGPLLSYDQKYGSTYIETLDTYLKNETIQKTACELSLSVSGLKYRLNKIAELGYNINSAQERFDMQLALNIFKIKTINS